MAGNPGCLPTLRGAAEGAGKGEGGQSAADEGMDKGAPRHALIRSV